MIPPVVYLAMLLGMGICAVLFQQGCQRGRDKQQDQQQEQQQNDQSLPPLPDPSPDDVAPDPADNRRFFFKRHANK